MTSIPASQLVSVIPGVLGAGGSPLSLNAVFLTESTEVPIGSLLNFSTSADVADYFGPSSDEARLADIYFRGYDSATQLPGTLYFYQLNTTDVAAYLRSGSMAAVLLATIQALTGTVIVTIDGRGFTSAAINLSGATSFSNAADLIQTGLRATGNLFSGTAAAGAVVTANQTALSTTMTVTAVSSGTLSVGDVLSGTGVDSGLTITALGSGTGGTGTYTVSTNTGFTSTGVTAASTKLTVSAVTTGTLAVDDVITGSGVTGGTEIDALGTGTGGVGTYTLSVAQHVLSTTVSVTDATPTVTFDAELSEFVITSDTEGVESTIGYATGTISTGLKLTAATDAILSQGADGADPETIMDEVTLLSQNWATFTTTFEADAETLLGLATWVTGTGDRYAFVGWDTDTGPTLSNDDAGSFGRLTETFDGVIPVYDLEQGAKAAFICGTIGAINFSRLNGRITLAYKSLAGLSADVTNATVAANLIANGYNFYGSYATANQAFTFLQPGQISGDWLWIDSYVNQIYLNSQFQLALMELLSNINSVPYNQDGYNLIRAACMDPINEGVNFGSIRAGIQLSSSQAAQVNSAAGVVISGVLQTQGWYLQILDPGAIVRGQRGTPTCTFWYVDGGSIQKITLSSIDIL